jgi:2-polyprenyl-3-methyl-5-hydroxy-6-metoxy-1,4-benzoquinol methylase
MNHARALELIEQLAFRFAKTIAAKNKRRHGMKTIVNPLRTIKSEAELAATNPEPWHIPDAPDDSHLGGYGLGPLGDRASYHPNLWIWAIKLLNIRSVIDIGCGEGCSSKFFLEAGCDVLGVEGYEPAVRSSRIPGRVVLHDYTTGPFVPDRDFDMAWSCEFIEHIEEMNLMNVFATFERAACVFLTFATPGQGGHHHVNEQDQAYWVSRFAEHGFDYDEELTTCGRIIAMADTQLISPPSPSYFTVTGLVFLKRG